MCSMTDTLKGMAKHVMRVLGRGHRESIYHRALITSLNRAGVAHRSEVVCPIYFMNEIVGMGKADLVIDDLVVEIKANKNPPCDVSPQLQKYLESLNKSERQVFRGAVINFNAATGVVDILEEACRRVVHRMIERPPGVIERPPKPSEPREPREPVPVESLAFRRSLRNGMGLRAPPIFKRRRFMDE